MPILLTSTVAEASLKLQETKKLREKHIQDKPKKNLH